MNEPSASVWRWPLRAVAVRPTRRYGLYLVVGGLTAAYLITGGRP